MEDNSPLEAPFGPPPRYPIESVDNALQVLSLFAKHNRLRVKDAATSLGVASGTAHRILGMLLYRGYVIQDPATKAYAPGPMLMRIGVRSIQTSSLRRIAEPHLKLLNEQLDETIQLATLHGAHVFFVDAIESSKALKVGSRAGTRQPAHCTSVGKAMLAELARAELLELYPSTRLPRVTPNSIALRSKLLIELDAVRDRGYAVNVGELEDGIGSVGCVIRDRDGHAIAAVGAGAPMSRLDKRRLRQLAEHVVATAAKIGDDFQAGQT